MAARQRRSRARKSDQTASPIGIMSRRTLLLSLLAVTTAIFFAFQLSRYRNEKSATGRFISSVLKSDRSIGASRRPSVGGSMNEDDKSMNFNDRISAFAKQFQMELGAIVKDKTASPEGKSDEQGGMAIVAGEEVIDHPVPSLTSTKHLPEKSPQDAAEDQQIGIQDLDQETLKAMFDALKARD